MVPLDKMLVETDSPYLSPEPKRGTRNDSSNIIYTIQKIAEVKNMSAEEVAQITYNNAIKIFKINVNWCISTDDVLLFLYNKVKSYLAIFLFVEINFNIFLASKLSTSNKFSVVKWNIEAIIFEGNNSSLVLYLVTESL